MRYLPTEDEQQWLLRALKSLVLARGYEQIALYPIIEPTRRFFPERWSFSESGLEQVTRRLLGYVGLESLGIRLTTVVEDDTATDGFTGTRCGGMAAAFLGIDQGRASFAFNVSAPADAEYMAGVMAHEVGHAYRAIHGLVVDDRAEEELLTDVTTIYLGFGILSANSSYRYRSAGEIHGGYVRQSWTIRSLGYLSPQGFAFLLGVQLLLRGLANRQPGRLLRHLEPNQQSFARATISELSRLAHYLPRTLGTPPITEWGEPIALPRSRWRVW